MHQMVMVPPPNTKYNVVFIFSRLLDLRQNCFPESLARSLAEGCTPVEKLKEKVSGYPCGVHVILCILIGRVDFGLLCGMKLGTECAVVRFGILGMVLAPENVRGWFKREVTRFQFNHCHGSRNVVAGGEHVRDRAKPRKWDEKALEDRPTGRTSCSPSSSFLPHQ